jgi:hypothetical protein
MGELIDSGDVELANGFDQTWWGKRQLKRQRPQGQGGAQETRGTEESKLGPYGLISGQAIRHPEYGNGTIQMVSRIHGKDHMLTVKFESGQRIHFRAPYDWIEKR